MSYWRPQTLYPTQWEALSGKVRSFFIFLLKYSWFAIMSFWYIVTLFSCIYIFFFIMVYYRILKILIVPCAEKAMAPHSSTLAWKIPWTEEPGRLQSMGSLRVGHDWATSLLLFTFMHWRRKWPPPPVFLPRESQGWGSLMRCCLWGCTEADTTERLSSSSSSAIQQDLVGYPFYIRACICWS